MEAYKIMGHGNIQNGDVLEFDYIITNSQFPYMVSVRGTLIEGYFTYNQVFIKLNLIIFDGATMMGCDRMFAEGFIVQNSFKKVK